MPRLKKKAETGWIRILSPFWISKMGDAVTYGKTIPEEIDPHDESNGFFIYGYAGRSVGYIKKAGRQLYHKGAFRYWIKIEAPKPSVPRRLALNPSFSKALPLP